MAPKLYTTDASPPCRAVLLTAKSLGITLEFREINLLNKEQLEPSYVKINPQHTIPTLDDDGFLVVDSHAINMYLVQKYGKNESLYPKNLKQRTLVDQRLFFDTGSVFTLLRSIVRLIRFAGAKIVPEEQKESAYETYSCLETFLTGQKWIAGETVTIADFSLVSSVTTLDVLVPIPEKKYPHMSAWIKRCQSLSYYGENQKGLDVFKAVFTKLMC